jgi:hypothetical protein
MEDVKEQIRDELSFNNFLEITKKGGTWRKAKRNSFIFDNIDSYAALTRENTSIKCVRAIVSI